MEAIIVIYAKENNHCLVFGREVSKGIIVSMNEGPEEEDDSSSGGNGQPPSRPKGPPKLSIVK